MSKQSGEKLKNADKKIIRRAKIICTIGPACSSEVAMRDLLRLGMDIARLNFSHGTHEDHAHNIQRLRRAAQREGRTVCVLQDLQGPKIRTGVLERHEPVLLKPGSVVTITPQNIPGNATRISTTFPDLARELMAGARVLLSDGLIELRVRSVRGDDVVCDVLNGGMLGEHKGINLPGVALSIPALTEKDHKDLEFGLKHGVDAVAISFVRSAADVSAVKQIIASHDSDVPVIAKLEKPQAIDHLEEILEAADGVMVARGDLGVEMAPEKVPVIQKHVIRRAGACRKPVITATQMLESMIENPRPTRAEASDVANAVFDGTDAVMLSAETASGKYPRESVSIMSRIVVEAECNMGEFVQFRRREQRGMSVAETICQSVAHAAEDLPMGAVAVFTETGNTARMISKHRPKAPIYAFTHFLPIVQRMNLYWGVHPVHCRQARSAEQMVNMAEKYLVRHGLLKPKDVLGVVAGTRQASGSTNLMRLHVVTEQEAERIARPKPRTSSARKKARSTGRKL
ncbi:MAG TPA: pyruvate kinase [Candidatus Sulfotelmatobacter sp.]|nr:pyruvate kinase [Candidatus Sulfotelmatobacter sp.]